MTERAKLYPAASDAIEPPTIVSSRDHTLYLTVTIDTEEDNWGEYGLQSYSVANIDRIPRLQRLFEDRGVRPTYLISYPVATSSSAVRVLGEIRERGMCEIGSHPHPWNTPPFEEARTPHNSYISNLDPRLQYAKLKHLHQAIAGNFGTAPTSYRSGRWAFSDDVARNLIRLGYTVDTSISPATDWSEYGGPDYSGWSTDPFCFQVAGSATEPGGSLMEVPASIALVQTRRRVVPTAYWAIKRSVPGGGRLLGTLRRLGLLNHVSISPETHDAADMIKLTRALVGRGTKVINMFFHSPSLLEKCSPFVRTEGEVTDFLARIDRFLAFATSAGLQSVTMSKLRASEVGASKIKVLDPVRLN